MKKVVQQHLLADRHPRTAAGYSADGTKVFLVLVDGRQSFSVGMSLPELADFMIQHRCQLCSKS